MAGLRQQWGVNRATCAPCPGKRLQLWGPPRVFCKTEGEGALAVLAHVTMAPQVPGCSQGLVLVGASQGETTLATISP